MLAPECGGERKRSILAGQAGGEEKLKPVLDRMLESGEVTVRRCYGGQRYALPKRRPA